MDIGLVGLEQDAVEEAAQFAPLLVLRRKQVIEATEAAARSGHASPESGGAGSTTEELLSDALDCMHALSEATRSADALYEEVLGGGVDVKLDFNEDRFSQIPPSGELCLHIQEVLPSKPPIGAALRRPPPSEECSGEGAALLSTRSKSSSAPVADNSDTVPPPVVCQPPSSTATEHSSWRGVDGSCDDAAASALDLQMPEITQVVGSVAEAGWTFSSSVAGALFSMAVNQVEQHPLETDGGCQACLEGLLRVNGDLAVDIGLLQETLRLVLYDLVEPLAQVRQITLTIPSDDHATSLFSTLTAGDRSGCSFAYRIYVGDPHDVEPLRETLLLEAESGGARRLLPLLTERLCDDGHEMPRHLKVRLDVRGGQ